MTILFIGDIVGRPGRNLVQKGLRALLEHYDVDVTIANAENAAAGFGLTRDIGETLLDWGVESYRIGACQIDARGALPLELEREKKARDYHLHAVAPLVMIAAAPTQTNPRIRTYSIMSWPDSSCTNCVNRFFISLSEVC